MLAVLLALAALLATTLTHSGITRAAAQTIPPSRIDGGFEHTVWLTPDGRAAATGANDSGQLGDGTTTDRSVSVFVQNLTNVVAVAAGENHSLAVDANGAVWAWGNNRFGQLGDGTFTSSSVPVQVDDTQMTDVIAIAAGGDHSLAIDSAGTAWAWGNGVRGQLGNGEGGIALVPVQVDNSAMTDVTAIAAGGDHSLAIDSAGDAWAWGSNLNGQLGDGSTTPSFVPIQVNDTDLSDVTAIAAGGDHSLAIDPAGDAWAWGSNLNGQLGDGTTTDRSVPVPVVMTDLPNGVNDIGAGGGHSLAIEDFPDLEAWAPWAWGNNNRGQLGAGSSGRDFHEPVPMNPPTGP